MIDVGIVKEWNPIGALARDVLTVNSSETSQVVKIQSQIEFLKFYLLSPLQANHGQKFFPQSGFLANFFAQFRAEFLPNCYNLISDNKLCRKLNCNKLNKKNMSIPKILTKYLLRNIVFACNTPTRHRINFKLFLPE